MLRLLDNNRPARFPEIKVDPSWKNCDFESLDELVDYADNWLGQHSPGKTLLRNYLGITERYPYGGNGDFLSIIKV